MAFRAKVILASIGPAEIPIYTIECTYPRFIHSEILTHRDRERNSASSRAIPWKAKGKHRVTISSMQPGSLPIGTGQFNEIGLDSGETYEYYVHNCMYAMLMNDPVIPIKFGREQSGMQTGDALSGMELEEATRIWIEARNSAIGYADRLSALGVHRSLCNRLTEPWMWITVVMTATEWKNFFRLRCHPAAEIHFQTIAGMIRDCIGQATLQKLKEGQWHLPYVEEKFDDIEQAKKISVGRCARVSYLTHDGKRDPSKDIELCDKLIKPPGDIDEDVMHASPFGHVASAACSKMIRSGPFRGWKQYRKEFPNENIEG